jgi:hypothetical protein
MFRLDLDDISDDAIELADLTLVVQSHLLYLELHFLYLLQNHCFVLCQLGSLFISQEIVLLVNVTDCQESSGLHFEFLYVFLEVWVELFFYDFLLVGLLTLTHIDFLVMFFDFFIDLQELLWRFFCSLDEVIALLPLLLLVALYLDLRDVQVLLVTILEQLRREKDVELHFEDVGDFWPGGVWVVILGPHQLEILLHSKKDTGGVNLDKYLLSFLYASSSLAKLRISNSIKH